MVVGQPAVVTITVDRGQAYQGTGSQGDDRGSRAVPFLTPADKDRVAKLAVSSDHTRQSSHVHERPSSWWASRARAARSRSAKRAILYTPPRDSDTQSTQDCVSFRLDLSEAFHGGRDSRIDASPSRQATFIFPGQPVAAGSGGAKGAAFASTRTGGPVVQPKHCKASNCHEPTTWLHRVPRGDSQIRLGKWMRQRNDAHRGL